MNAPPVASGPSLADFLALVRDRCDASPERTVGEVLRDELECLRPDLASAILHISRHWDAPEDAPAGYFPEGVPFKVEGAWCYPAFSPDADARLTGCSLQQAYMLGFDDASDSAELRELFSTCVSSALAVLHIEEIDLANELAVSLSTVKRWKNGKAFPHPIMRKPVYDALTRHAAAHRLVNEIVDHLEARFDLDFGDIDDIDDGAEIKAAWVALALKHMGGDS